MLIQSLGLGVFLTASAVFFTRTIGIPAQRVGLARVRVSAQMRSLFNLGFLGGAALAGAAIAAGTSTALYATVLANAALQLVSVAVLLGMQLPAGARPRGTAAEAPGGVLRSAALRDVRYVAVALVCGALELYHPLLTVGLPLWIVSGTDAPALLVSGLLILDTVLVLLFQFTVSRGAGTPAGAARMLRWAGWALGASCLVFAVSGGHGALLDSAALLGGALVLVLGELYQASASWGLSFGLAPAGRQGEYQTVFSLGRGLQQFAGPWLMTSVVVGAAATGRLVLAALFALLGFAAPPLVRGLEKARTRTEPAPA